MNHNQKTIESRSLGGGCLPPGSIVRHVYLDEAGVSGSQYEPHVVVAAAITNPDRHWHEIVNYYDHMALDWLPDLYDPDENGHFIFHAKDVWHGSNLFDRERFSIQERMKILYQLAQAPDLLAIPIVVGALDKRKFPPEIRDEPNGVVRKQIHHGLAFNLALQQVDRWMEVHCPGQVCMVTAEDTDSVKQAFKVMQSNFQTNGMGYTHENPKKFLSRTIVDTVNFAPKQFSPIMQMADHVAFMFRRKLLKCERIGQYMKMIQPAIWTMDDRDLRHFTIFHNMPKNR